MWEKPQLTFDPGLIRVNRLLNKWVLDTEIDLKCFEKKRTDKNVIPFNNKLDAEKMITED